MRTKVMSQADFSDIVSIEEAMEHSRITDSYDEIVVRGCLDAAHDAVQQWLNRKLTLSTIAARVTDFRTNVTLPFPPVHSVTSVTATDSDNETVTLEEGTDWKFDTITESVKFLDTFNRYEDFEFEYSAGYEDVDCVPKAVVHAIKMTFATLYENREDTVVGTQVNEVPLTARRLINAHKVPSSS